MRTRIIAFLVWCVLAAVLILLNAGCAPRPQWLGLYVGLQQVGRADTRTTTEGTGGYADAIWTLDTERRVSLQLEMVEPMNGGMPYYRFSTDVEVSHLFGFVP